MKVLLINPPCDPRTIGLRHIAKIEPLGLELIGAAIKDNHDVRIVDMEVAPEDLWQEVESFHPDIVGITSEIVHLDQALNILKSIKKKLPHCLTVVGGHHASMCAEAFAHANIVDLIVVGEGVFSFKEICDFHASGRKDFTEIQGIALVCENNTLKFTTARPIPLHLDDYPFPDRSLTKKYRHLYYYLFEKSVAAVRTSFGCSHHCIFCSVRVYSKGKFIARSAEKVFKEIRSIEESFIMFCDDHSFIDPDRMRKLGQMLLDAGIKKRYFVYARTDSIVQHKDVFKLWAKVGLTLVMAGLEAIDEDVLKRAGKRVSTYVNEEALKIAEECGFS